MTSAIRTAAFINTLGVNTHLDFAAYGYQNVSTVDSAISYLGIGNLRDSAEDPNDATLWQEVAQATGVHFDDYIAETSPAGMQTDLSYVTQLAHEGILNYAEGGNEEDDPYPESLGNTLAITAQFQQQLYALGHQLGLPVINMSFGAGWTATNDWQGDYGDVGDLSAYCDYANAHTYPLPGQLPPDSIDRVNGLAQLAASSRPVMTTEIGWDANQGFTATQIASYTLDAALDGIKYGDVKMYYYALFDDGSGAFGLMHADGTPKPAGVALHDLTTLLRDTGGSAGSFTPGSLNYTLSANDNTVLMEKSDGTFWLAVWNESTGTHTDTLTLGSAASQITLYNPLTGTSAVRTVSNTGTFKFTVPTSPVIIEIAGGSLGSGPLPDPVVSAPASEQAAAGATIAVTGVSVADQWATSQPGSLRLKVVAGSGAVAMTQPNGSPATGSGTEAVVASGTLAQLNADLATLSYRAGTTNATLRIHVWDQAGIEGSNSVAIDLSGSGSSDPITIDAGTYYVVEDVSSATISASSGDHMIFIGGTGDRVTATGGTETIQAFQGGNVLRTGAGNDTIQYAGAHNVINAGGGSNLLEDSGGHNRIVLPHADHGYDDIFGYVMTNGDMFDMRSMLAATNWNGDASSLGNFVKVATSGANAVIAVDPTGVAGGATYTVATLEGVGAQSLTSLLAHSIT